MATQHYYSKVQKLLIRHTVRNIEWTSCLVRSRNAHPQLEGVPDAHFATCTFYFVSQYVFHNTPVEQDHRGAGDRWLRPSYEQYRVQ